MSKLAIHAGWFVALVGSIVWTMSAPASERLMGTALGVTFVICWSMWALKDTRSRHSSGVSEQDRVDDRPPHERIPTPHAVGR